MSLHVDYEIRWKNYRAFKDTGWIKTAPLTVLIGPNNSGKTSIISPFLLLNQTMSSRDALTPLVTRGPLMDAGMYKDIVHDHISSNEVFLGLRYHMHETKGRLGKVGKYPPGAVELTLGAGILPEDVILRQFELFDIHKRSFLKSSRKSKNEYTFESDAIHPLKPRELDAIRKNRPVNFLFSPAAALHAYQEMSSTKEEVSFGDYSRPFVMYITALSVAFEELRDLLRNMSYIGPLRERPKRYYG
jgi:hypothetical protein